MRASYNREDDVLTLELSEGDIVDHAEEVDGVILHLSPDDRPVLLELLDASDLLAKLSRVTARALTSDSVAL